MENSLQFAEAVIGAPIYISTLERSRLQYIRRALVINNKLILNAIMLVSYRRAYDGQCSLIIWH